MYTEKLKVAFDSTTASSLASAAVVKKYAFFRPAYVRRIGIGVTTAIVSTGSVVVTIKKYPTMGSNSGEVSLGTITIPAGTAAGKVFYKALGSVKLIEGDELVFEVTTAAAGGGAAGAGVCMFDADDNPEMPANNSDMVASA